MNGWNGYSYHQTPPLGVLHVVDEAGTVIATKEIESYYRKEWDLLRKYYGEPDAQDIIRIPKANIAKFDTRTPLFMGCSYEATKDYLANQLGVSLHSTDRDWLALHPFAEEYGVSAVNLPSALHELVVPYGLGVSRIRYRRGLFLGGDEQANWMATLGTNPLALVSHAVSNEEAAAILGVSVEELNDQCRVDFTDQPFRPGVIGESGWTGGGTGGAQASFGHASYVAPRSKDKSSTWSISLQFDRLERISYRQAPVLPAYVPRPAETTFFMSDLQRPDGKALDHAHWLGHDDYVPDAAAKEKAEKEAKKQQEKADKKHQKAVSHPSLYIPGTKRLRRPPFSAGGIQMDRVLCQICNEWHWLENVEAHVDVCRRCYEKAWLGLRCPHKVRCGLLLSNVRAPIFLGIDGAGRPVLHCPECYGKLLPPSDRPELTKIFSPASKPQRAGMSHDTHGETLTQAEVFPYDD